MHTDVNVCRMLQERAGGTRTDEDFEADDAEAGVQLSCPPSAYWHCHFIRLPLVTPGYPWLPLVTPLKKKCYRF